MDILLTTARHWSKGAVYDGTNTSRRRLFNGTLEIFRLYVFGNANAYSEYHFGVVRIVNNDEKSRKNIDQVGMNFRHTSEYPVVKGGRWNLYNYGVNVYYEFYKFSCQIIVITVTYEPLLNILSFSSRQLSWKLLFLLRLELSIIGVNKS